MDKSSKGTTTGELVTSVGILLIFWLMLSLPHRILSAEGIISVVQHIIVGIPLSYLIIRITGEPLLSSAELETHLNPGNFIRLVYYTFYLMWQILLAGIDVAKRVMVPTLNISPGIVKFHTPLHGDIPTILNANSITLTPGTITVDVEKDETGSTFWVHCISQDAVVATKEGKGFVDKILWIYGGKV